MNQYQNIPQRKSLLTPDLYERLYAQSITAPETFWGEKAKQFLSWVHPWDSVQSGSFTAGTGKWFEGGVLNVSYNCIDRHIEAGRGEAIAIIWEGNNGETKQITYRSLRDEVCRLANLLKKQGVQRGDRVCIYMPMRPEAAYAMLACARIGAVHSVVFGGFSSEALATRIRDAACMVVVTADVGRRGEKVVSLKAQVDVALASCPSVTATICLRTEPSIDMPAHARDVDYLQATRAESTSCPPEPMGAEDPLFILYTSGSTGKPKGILHSTAGYLLYAAMTHRYVFDYNEGDIYWCTADVGWITGHSYVVYGPLCNGATTLMFEGVPTYPTPARYWEIVDKYAVNILYTTPTALRMLMAHGDEYVRATSRSSLRVLGSVGEPINPEAWRWYHEVVGEGECPIVDTWWQTETGGIAITPLPGVAPLKPGSAWRPFFGIEAVLVAPDGSVVNGVGSGALYLRGAWPGHLRDIYGDHERCMETYFSQHPGLYCTGDRARRDEEGYLWITGRMDDALNISGHLIGTAEVEGSITLHSDVVEAAAVAVPHPIKGESMFVFVCVVQGTQPGAQLIEELMQMVKEGVGSFAKPETICFVPDLPKTRSGKIMRRILKRLAVRDFDNLGDTSTLANEHALQEIMHAISTR